ncbi:CgeB family protein [Kocuria sp. UCD-OTCP]|uniref:CgeB family protein n=1 Tax=Kocuria sp. UCD-OTCP TaxID=1292021 RepID=UPI0009DB016C|nr:glycosyltransferase [Kocuria sp. UCD-OTCP]
MSKASFSDTNNDSKAFSTIFGEDPQQYLADKRSNRNLHLPRMAAVLDDFSTQCFESITNYFPIAKSDYQLALERLKPRFLFIESAWNGNNGDWLYQLTSPTGPKKELIDLTHQAKRLGIPVVFWNKEDPPHFSQFLPVAKLADFVFTTEANLIPSYKSEVGHAHVDSLRFAAQPSIHRPAEISGHRSGDIAFAGQYFRHKFPERKQQMDFLFPAAAKHNFSIYSRVMDGNPDYSFPTEYEKFIVGSLPYSAMVRAYREHKIFLNVNSVPSSPTMCARRVYELASSKTLVVSPFSEAIRNIYPEDEIILVRDENEASEAFDRYLGDDELRRSTAHKAWRRTGRLHTYRHRLNQILTTLGEPEVPLLPRVHVILRHRGEGDLPRLLSEVQRQTIKSEVEVYLDDGYRDFEYQRHELPGVQPLRNILTEKLDISDDYVTVMDSRIEYGPNYLVDLALYLRDYTEAPWVSKPLIRGFENAEVPGAREDTLSDWALDAAWMARGSAQWKDIVRQTQPFGSKIRVPLLDERAYHTDVYNIKHAASTDNVTWRL